MSKRVDQDIWPGKFKAHYIHPDTNEFEPSLENAMVHTGLLPKIDDYDKLFYEFSSDQLETICDKIDQSKTVPKLPFVKELFTKMSPLNPIQNSPHWVIPYSVVEIEVKTMFHSFDDRYGSPVLLNEDGFLHRIVFSRAGDDYLGEEDTFDFLAQFPHSPLDKSLKHYNENSGSKDLGSPTRYSKYLSNIGAWDLVDGSDIRSYLELEVSWNKDTQEADSEYLCRITEAHPPNSKGHLDVMQAIISQTGYRWYDDWSGTDNINEFKKEYIDDCEPKGGFKEFNSWEELINWSNE
tara:strand:- start:317 stop:1198 length:882 start_codon:yes stop_codon:yes gene_type:complete